MATPAAVFFQGMGAAGGGGGSAFNPASPGPIGGTTPGAGSFTTLNNSGVHTNTNATDATALGTGALVLTVGGASFNGQVRVGSALTVVGTATVGAVNASGTSTFSGRCRASGAGGVEFGGTGTGTTTDSGFASAYRVGGTLENIGSLVLQTDVGQATAGIYFYTGTTPTRKVGISASGTLLSGFGIADLSTVATSWAAAGSQTIGNNTWMTVNTNTVLIASYTITMPAAPVAGQLVRICSSGVVTSMTVNANAGQTIQGAPTSMAANQCMEWQFIGAIWTRTI